MQSNERKRILALVENGTISAEEAIVLLENLANQQESTAPQTVTSSEDHSKDAQNVEEEPFIEEQSQQSTSNEESAHKQTTGFEDIFGKAFNNKELNGKVEELVKDLKNDLSDFGSRMSTLFNSTFTKIKGFESDVPFGEKLEFSNSYAFNPEEVRGIDIDVPNGKVEVEKTIDDIVSVNISVKTKMQESEEYTKKAFLEDFIELKDGKLTIQTPSKFSQVTIKIALPEREYDLFFVRAINSHISVDSLKAKLVKANLMNGSITMHHTEFEHADLKTKNGSIETRYIKGDDLEAETANGRIYIDGEVKEIEAESFNGHVIVTTTSDKARKLKASTIAGSVEIYVPTTVGLDGKLTTNLGKFDLCLTDISQKVEDDSILQKVTYFDKTLPGATLLKVQGESRSGTVLVRYSK